MSSCCAKCFHCKQSLPAEPVTVTVDGVAKRVCSQACADTVTEIVNTGLSDFYRHRDEPSIQVEKRAQGATWEAYERPAVMKQFVRERANGLKAADLLIQGVHCAACTWLIENTLSRRAGVESIEVNPVTTRAELTWDPAKISLAELLAEIHRIGYTPFPFTERKTQAAAEEEKRLALRRLLVAGLGMMQVTSYAIAMYAGAFQGMDPDIQEFFRLISLVVATPVVLYSGAPFFLGAWRNLQARSLGMDVPVALAIGAAWAASVWNTFTGSGEVFFDSATMFVFFLSGTRYLEAAGRFRAFDLTHALAQHIPQTATRLVGNKREEVGIMELSAGDTVLVAEGRAFPADGRLIDDATSVDQAMLTGESEPVRRHKDDAIVAGTINTGPPVRICVDNTGAETVLAQIGRLVTQAGVERPKLVQLTDKIASWFVISVLLIALATGLYWWQADASRAFEIVLTVLVVTCPCALALATPAALAVATSTLARNGFLIRRAGALPALAKVNHVIADKTGTLTANELEISRVIPGSGLTSDTVMGIAAALEVNSAHPIARAFRSVTQLLPATDLKTVAGCGLEGVVNGTSYRIGTLDFASRLQGDQHNSLLRESNPDKRNVYLGNEYGLIARFEISERLRDGAHAFIAALGTQNIGVTIASGDLPTAVESLAIRIGAESWQAGMLPEDKLELVRNLQANGKHVAAIGDGVNDSPVLAGADVSIAMGNGTSIAQHSADCVWLGHKLSGLDGAFFMARRTMQIVKQNLAWALCYNTLAIPLAVSGMIEPWMAALGMSFSSLLVMLNALRLGSNKAGLSGANSQQDLFTRQISPEPVS